MPTTITSAGITFNDATSQTTSALAANAIGTTQIANNAVTAAKLGANEQKQICKAWVNFNGTGATTSPTAITATQTLVASSGGTTLTWTGTGFGATVGETYVFTIGGSSVIGGVNVNPTTGGVRLAITSASSTIIVLTLASGTFTSAVNHTANGSNSTSQAQAIRSSYSVSSITKGGVGSYVVNLITPMADINYVATASIGVGGGSTRTTATNPTSASALAVFVSYPANTAGAGASIDDPIVQVAIFGN